MDPRMHFFSQKDVISAKIAPEYLGIRGRQANEFAELGFPILPGFIIDSRLASVLNTEVFPKEIKANLKRCSEIVGKQFGNPENPMLLKLVISTNLAVSNYPTLHNFGLVRDTIKGFSSGVGDNFAAHEVLFLVRGVFRIIERLSELETEKKYPVVNPSVLETLNKELKSDHPSKDASGFMEYFAQSLPEGFFDSAERQLEVSLKMISDMLSCDDQNDNDTAILIQPMVYGNYGKDSCSGWFYTRNVVTGEKGLQGDFYREKFNEFGASGQDIGKITPEHLKELQRIGWTLEDRLKEIRQVRFTVEKGKLWLIEQRAVDSKSTQADIKLLLDLAKRKIVDDAFVINSIQPGRLNEILHPIIEKTSIKNLPVWTGGIAGAPGAAIGKCVLYYRLVD
jgi:pyruvate,orthophosphate dikinase